MHLESYFLMTLPFNFGKILNFGISSFPASITPGQNIFEAINRIVIAIEVVFNPNFKKGTTMIIPQNTQDRSISMIPRIWVFFRFLSTIILRILNLDCFKYTKDYSMQNKSLQLLNTWFYCLPESDNL